MRLWQNLVRIYNIILFRTESDQSFMRASSLTFQSLLSIVPILAVMFGIAKGFGIEKLLENVLRREFQDQEQIISYYIEFGYTLLQQAQGGIIAGIGIIILLITVMRLLSNIEDSLNAMWGCKIGRTLVRKASDYLAIILICPILLTASSSITLFLTTNIEKLSASQNLQEHLGPLVHHAIPIIPFVMSTLLFTIVYIIMPNTHVRLVSSLWAGLFAGCSYQILQATYISIQLKISNAGAIYGSFAALPLFLMWLYLSWLLFLIGAQIVVIHQERLWDPKILAPYRNLSPFEKQLVMLACCKVSVDRFIKGSPVTVNELSNLLNMPERQVTELVEELIEAHIAFKVDGEYAIVPAQNAESLNVVDTLAQINGSNQLTNPLVTRFEEIVRKMQQESKKSPLNVLLKDVVL